MPTAKAVDNLYVSRVFLGDVTDDTDPKTGLIDLGFKDKFVYDFNQNQIETRFDSSSKTMGWAYSLVDNPTIIQQKVIELINEALGNGWIFRQLRDYNEPNDKLATRVKSDLRSGPSYTPLVIVYQRNTPLPIRTIFTEKDGLNELRTLTNYVIDISDKITDIAKPRYTLTGVQVVYDWHSDWGRTGEGGDDIRICMSALFFDDKLEQLYDLRSRRKKFKREVKEIEDQIKDLEVQLKC